MRKNRGSSNTAALNTTSIHPSTPLVHNQNSNSCSNDTISSSMSSSNTGTNLTANPIILNEIKIRNLLKELQVFVKQCQEERVKSEPNLLSITKTHDKIKKDKISTFYRKKLRTMYDQSLKDSDNEIKSLRRALDCINQIRHTQNEIRLLQQQQNSILSSPTITSNLISYTHNQESNDKPVKKGPVTMRRGVLMSILQQAAFTLPLWVGEIGQNAPHLCGSIPPEANYICKPGDKVAALVKNNNAKNSSMNKMEDIVDDEVEEENWILAEVVAYHSNTGKYDVDDVDAEEGQERHTLSKKNIVPLPLWRANPLTDPEAIFAKDSLVLALYPQTTCFYRGIISESPQTPQEDYLILFEDNTYPEGYSPPLNVPQLYVVDCSDFKK